MPLRTSASVALVGILALCVAPAVARAQDTPVRAAMEEKVLSYWQQGDARWFVSGYLEGGLYAKPQIQAGYGKPHWMWVGVDAFALTSWQAGMVYAGVRGSLPFADLRIGVRDTLSYNRSFLTPMDSYTSADINGVHGSRARYLTGEAELVLTVPVPLGYFAVVETAYVTDAPRDTFLYEESLRAVMKAPFIVGNRAAYVFNIGKNDFLKIGPLFELIVLPGRGASVARLGPAGTIQITDHLSGQAALSFPVSSPDRLDIYDGPFGVLGVTYAWATGDAHPRFP